MQKSEKISRGCLRNDDDMNENKLLSIRLTSTFSFQQANASRGQSPYPSSGQSPGPYPAGPPPNAGQVPNQQQQSNQPPGPPMPPQQYQYPQRYPTPPANQGSQQQAMGPQNHRPPYSQVSWIWMRIVDEVIGLKGWKGIRGCNLNLTLVSLCNQWNRTWRVMYWLLLKNWRCS